MNQSNITNTSNPKPWQIAAIVALIYCVVALFLQDDFGPTWDAAMGDYAFGHQLKGFLSTGDASQLEAPINTAAHRQPFPTMERKFGWHQLYPVTALLAAFSTHYLWDEWDLMGALNAAHFVIILLNGLLLFFLVRNLGHRLGIPVALLSALFLILCPRFFSHGMNNLKDAPELVFYSLSLLVAYRALRTGSGLRWWMLLGFVVALAAAQKANAAFIPLQLLIYCAIAQFYRESWQLLGFRDLLRGALAALVTFLGSYALVSPQLWPDFWPRLVLHFEESASTGNALLGTGVGGFSNHALLQVLTTTPLVILILALVGSFSRQAPQSFKVFLFCWLLVPIGRNFLPGMRQFDGVRHFMEFYPALAILAALGCWSIKLWCQKTWNLRAARVALATMIIGSGYGLLTTYPLGICYFNETVGGLAGAQAKDLGDANDYWGHSYQSAMQWLNENAEPNAVVMPTVAPWIMRCAAPGGLREDLDLYAEDRQFSGYTHCYLLYIMRPGWHDGLTRWADRQPPLHEIKVQGATVLRIHRFDCGSSKSPILRWAQEQKEVAAAEGRLRNWVLRGHNKLYPEIEAITSQLDILGEGETRRRLCDIFPQELHQDVARVLAFKLRRD